jgi:hypothetical protein
MTVLTLLLPSGADRWANIGVGLFTMAMIVAMNLKPDLDNVFFMGIQLIALIAIVGIAWRWQPTERTDAITPKCAASDRLVQAHVQTPTEKFEACVAAIS